MRSPVQQLRAWLPQEGELLKDRPSLVLSGLDEEAARELAEQMSRWYSTLQPHWPRACILLQGALGAGKTHFSQSFIASLAEIDRSQIESPTYAYLIPYTAPGNAERGPFEIFHFDLYRIEQKSQLLALGLDEIWHERGMSLIEWPDHALQLAPWPRLFLTLEYESPQSRLWRCDWQTCHPKEVS